MSVDAQMMLSFVAAAFAALYLQNIFLFLPFFLLPSSSAAHQTHFL